MRTNTRLMLMVAATLSISAGCATKVRNLTASSWSSEGMYVAYWEGTCKALLGCDLGDGKLQWCTLNEDNSLTCAEQTEVSALLARKAK